MAAFISKTDILKAEQEIGDPRFGPLGWITDYRTYRRWLPEKKRRETFFERNARVVNYNVSLAIGMRPTDELQEEADLMFEIMNNFLGFASGRTLWVGGTETSDKNPACNFNCSALAINRLEAFLTLFELLMLGTGVGFRVFKKDISKLPKIKNLPKIKILDYQPVDKKNRLEDTVAIPGKEEFEDLVFVGDSRRGWVEALEHLLREVFYGNAKKITFNLNSIRPMGERINGFGGTASGPDALISILQNVYQVIQERGLNNSLLSIDCMDICDAIAKGVVAGSSRRSALICLFDQGDELCANAKVNMPKHKSYRWQSNNTECIGSHHVDELRFYLESNPNAQLSEITEFIDQFKPSLEWFEKKFETIAISGEPGLNNYLLMCAKRWIAIRQWRPNVSVDRIWELYCDVITNPCHEIILSAGYSLTPSRVGNGVSFCNLTTLPLQNFVIRFKTIQELSDWTLSRSVYSYFAYADIDNQIFYALDYELLERSVRLITRIGLRQTCVEMPTVELNETQTEERLLGVSATGWRKMMDMLGWKTAGSEIVDLQKRMREWANDEATKYAAKLDVPRPLLVTCIKPEGCLDKEALRVTDQGILTADEINPNIYFDYGFSEDISGYTRDGLAIPRTYNSGASEGVKITLNNGRTLLSTKAHPFSVNGEWIEAQFIEPGQTLDCQLGTYLNGTESALVELDKNQFVNPNGQFDVEVYKTPKFMSPDLAWLIGNYFANGCFTESKSRIKLHCQRLDIHQKAQTIWVELFGVETNIIKSTDRDSYNQDFGSVYLLEWFKINGLYKAPNMCLQRIPKVIRQSSYESVLAFIAGLADGDGCFYGSSFCIDNKSSEFIRHIQQVGESVGISFSHIENSERDGHSEGSIFKCHASRTYSLDWAFDLINKHSVKAIEKPLISSNNKNKAKNPYVVVANESAGVINTYDVEVSEEHWYYTGGIKSHNTGSKVFGSSDGLHWEWAPYYIRRIQMSTTDALAKALKEQDFIWHPTPYDLDANIKGEDTWDRLEAFNKMEKAEKDALFSKSNAVVFSFPVKAEALISQGEVSAIEQLENVRSFAVNYTDHLPSSTVTVKPDEWKSVAEWVHTNWKEYITAAFLSYWSGNYPLLPYEDIDKKTYQELLSSFDPTYITETGFKVDEALVNKYEVQDIEEGIDIDDVELTSGSCSTGACPIR